MPDLSDVEWLRARIQVGATTKEIATEVGQTPRTVRNALHRHGIPLPSQLRREAIDVEVVLADYRRGVPLNRIAAGHAVSPRRVAALAADHRAKRDVPLQPKRRDSKFVDPGRGNIHTAFNPGAEATVLYATFFEAPSSGPLTITDRVEAPDDCAVEVGDHAGH